VETNPLIITNKATANTDLSMRLEDIVFLSFVSDAQPDRFAAPEWKRPHMADTQAIRNWITATASQAATKSWQKGVD
jgi:hypothetical protein